LTASSAVGTRLDDRELVARAKEGDVDAYAALLRTHGHVARRLAAVVCGAGDADEAAQDAFVKAWYALGRFREGSAFRPWLLRIVANEARNRRRAAGRRAGYELRFAADRSAGDGVTVATPEAALLAATTRDTLRVALAGLPPRQRDVVTCRYLAGLSEQETAQVLGLARGTVKSRAARGLARLRADLDDRAVGPDRRGEGGDG
jgi:RNA polymerase sigma-70 factor (ECF subfamily)